VCPQAAAPGDKEWEEKVLGADCHGAILFSRAWRSPGDGGKLSPNSFSELECAMENLLFSSKTQPLYTL